MSSEIIDLNDAVIVRNKNLVEAWSVERLRYKGNDPVGVHQRFREELAVSLGLLECNNGEIIHGLYASSDCRRRCDAENIVFYNPGRDCFSRLAGGGLRFERCFSSPPKPPRGPKLAHYLKYFVQEFQCPFERWRPASVIAEWKDVRLGSFEPSKLKSREIWRSFRQAALMDGAVSVQGRLEHRISFGIRVALHTPRSPVNPARFLKDLLDGIISAFQRHSGDQLEVISGLLARELNVTNEDTKAWLTDSRTDALGETNLVHVVKNRPRFSPSDERCVAAEVLVGPRTMDGGVAVSGTIFAVDSIVRPWGDSPER